MEFAIFDARWFAFEGHLSESATIALCARSTVFSHKFQFCRKSFEKWIAQGACERSHDEMDEKAALPAGVLVAEDQRSQQKRIDELDNDSYEIEQQFIIELPPQYAKTIQVR